MTFKQLTQELLLEGWRAYQIDPSLLTETRLAYLAKRNSLEVQVYEGHKVIFVKDIFEKEKA